MAPDYSRTDIKIIRASKGVVETEIALALCVQKRLQVHPEHINWWHMDLEQTNLTVQEDFIQRQSFPNVGQLWRYDTYERMAHSAHLQAAILEMTDPDQGRLPAFFLGTRREIAELRPRPLRDIAYLRLGETVLLTSHSPTAQSPAPETSLQFREYMTITLLKPERTPTPDPSQPDLPAQPDPLPKLEQIDSASPETIVVKKESDSSQLKDEPDPGFLDDSKVTIDTERSQLKVEKSEEDNSGG